MRVVTSEVSVACICQLYHKIMTLVCKEWTLLCSISFVKKWKVFLGRNWN